MTTIQGVEGLRSKRSLPLAAPELGKRWTGKSRRYAATMISATIERRSEALAPFLDAGQAWLDVAAIELAQLAGGQLGPIGHAIIATSALQLAWSRYWHHAEAAKKDPEIRVVEAASRLGDAARLNMTAAYELAIRIARATGTSSGDPLDAVVVPATDAQSEFEALGDPSNL